MAGEMQKVIVIGAAGAGKTSMAKNLSHALSIPFLPTDPLYWGDDWAPVPIDDVMLQVQQFMAQDSWMLDGNFEDQRNDVWAKADTVFWLDYSIFTILSRNLRRNIAWCLTGRSDWSGNRMSPQRIIIAAHHCIKSYYRKRRVYTRALSEFANFQLFHFRTPKDVIDFFGFINKNIR